MDFIARILLNHKKKKLKRTVKVFNLSTAKTALILYEVKKDQKAVIDFSRFLKEEGIKAEAVGFFKKKNKEDVLPKDELSYIYYDKKQLNWLKFPSSTKLQEVIKKEYHLLIDLNLDDISSLEIISSLSIANFKVGCAKGYQKEVCELNISTEKNETSYFIEQIKKYLNIINN